jgi:hypothetical protein
VGNSCAKSILMRFRIVFDCARLRRRRGAMVRSLSLLPTGAAKNPPPVSGLANHSPAEFPRTWGGWSTTGDESNVSLEYGIALLHPRLPRKTPIATVCESLRAPPKPPHRQCVNWDGRSQDVDCHLPHSKMGYRVQSNRRRNSISQ